MRNSKTAKYLVKVIRHNNGFIDQKEADAFKSWYKFLANISSKVSKDKGLKSLDDVDIKMRFQCLQDHVASNFNNPERLEVHKIIDNLLTDIAEEVKKVFPMFSFRPILVGSGKEGTRPYLPNEFDYHLVCDKIRECVDVNYYQSDTSCNLIKVKPSHRHKLHSDLYDSDHNLNMDGLRCAMDNILKQTINCVFHRNLYKTVLRIDSVFLDENFISCLHVTWRGTYYKDMHIYIDLVVALELNSYKCYADVFRSVENDYKDRSKYFVFNKGSSTSGFAIAFNDTEYRLLRDCSLSAKQGFIYAKALRIGDLFPDYIRKKLNHVYNLEDCLKTYMLKTSMFFCSLYMKRVRPQQYRELQPLQWTYFVYKHLERRFALGHLPSLLSWNSSFFECSVITCISYIYHIHNCVMKTAHIIGPVRLSKLQDSRNMRDENRKLVKMMGNINNKNVFNN